MGEEEMEEVFKTLPMEKLPEGIDLCFYEGHWYPSRFIHGIIPFQQQFKARDTDLMLVTFPKSGTTWWKALAFTIANRNNYPFSESPLLTTNPHGLVPFLDDDVYGKNPILKLEDLPSPRVLGTHMPHSTLPTSIKDTDCRVVYLCRNPLDLFISLRHFFAKLPNTHFDPNLLEESFDMFCRGVTSYGPFWDHVLEYWKASRERPDKVNKNEKNKNGRPYSTFFRKGEVGDWSNYLTPSMLERMNKLMEEKFDGSGLNFKFS
ncbi:hypothetical protein ACSBR2_023843 [Camellia fascicularis]